MVPALPVVWMGRGCRVHTHFFSAVSPPFGCTRCYLASSVFLGLWCCPRAFSGCTVSSLRLLSVEHRLWALGLSSCRSGTQESQALEGTADAVWGLSCSTVCGIFLGQGSNPCPLRWQMDCYPPGKSYAHISNTVTSVKMGIYRNSKTSKI